MTVRTPHTGRLQGTEGDGRGGRRWRRESRGGTKKGRVEGGGRGVKRGGGGVGMERAGDGEGKAKGTDMRAVSKRERE